MGWSCRKDAGDAMDRIIAACVGQTGSSNVFESSGKRYFFENSRTEYDDGAITGTIFRFVGETYARKSGSFRIEGDGTITRAPAFMKKAGKEI